VRHHSSAPRIHREQGTDSLPAKLRTEKVLLPDRSRGAGARSSRSAQGYAAADRPRPKKTGVTALERPRAEALQARGSGASPHRSGEPWDGKGAPSRRAGGNREPRAEEIRPGRSAIRDQRGLQTRARNGGTARERAVTGQGRGQVCGQWRSRAWADRVYGSASTLRFEDEDQPSKRRVAPRTSSRPLLGFWLSFPFYSFLASDVGATQATNAGGQNGQDPPPGAGDRALNARWAARRSVGEPVCPLVASCPSV